MKRFARVLQELMDEHQLTQVEVSNLSNIQQTKISRLLRGFTRVDRDDLVGLFSAFPDSKDRYRLSVAHIQDELPQGTLDQLHIEPQGDRLHDQAFTVPHDLPRRLEHALAFVLSEIPEIPSIIDVLIGFATSLGWDEKAAKPGPKPASKTKYPSHKRRVTRGSEAGLTDKALEILKEGRAGGHDVHPKQSK